MAKYRNRKPTIFTDDNQTRIPVGTELDSLDLNGKTTKEVMRLRVLDADNKETGPDIEFQPNEEITGL